MTKDINWTDTHCHLEMLEGSPEEHLELCKKQGVGSCITIGTTPDSNQRVKELTHQFSQVWGTYGIHPLRAGQCTEEDFQWIQTEIQGSSKIVAIGECGYDFYYEHATREQQREAFARQLEMAVELDYPVVIHTREAEPETKEMMAPFISKGLRGVLHSFTSSLDLAKFAIDSGFYLSFNGICTFKKSDEIREVLRFTPLQQMLIETDSPYLTPVPLRGKPNTPGNVSIVGKFIAQFLGLEEQNFSHIMAENTQKLFFQQS